MENLTLISCSYNTPKVTENMLKSFLMFHPNTEILICENSKTEETRDILKTANIPFIQPNTEFHSPSVDALLENINTDYALLVDTDIIFLKNNDMAFKTFKDMELTLMGDIIDSVSSHHNRVNPCHCFINVKNIKQYNIKFHDIERTDTSEQSNGRYYDVGSSFLEDVLKEKLKVGDYKGNTFDYKHYGSMSWAIPRYISDINITPDRKQGNHRDDHIYNIGLNTLENYIAETQILENIVLKYK